MFLVFLVFFWGVDRVMTTVFLELFLEDFGRV